MWAPLTRWVPWFYYTCPIWQFQEFSMSRVLRASHIGRPAWITAGEMLPGKVVSTRHFFVLWEQSAYNKRLSWHPHKCQHPVNVLNIFPWWLASHPTHFFIEHGHLGRRILTPGLRRRCVGEIALGSLIGFYTWWWSIKVFAEIIFLNFAWYMVALTMMRVSICSAFFPPINLIFTPLSQNSNFEL